MDPRGRKALAAAVAAPEMTPATSPVYDVPVGSSSEQPGAPALVLKLRAPCDYEVVYEWHQKRAHELVELGVIFEEEDGVWRFAEQAASISGGSSAAYHSRVKAIIPQLVESAPVHWAQIWPG